MTIDLSDLLKTCKETTDEPPCSGLIFRTSISNYKTPRFAVHHDISFHLLKRKSCPGCSECGGYYDMLTDSSYIIHYPDDIKHNDLVTLQYTNVHRDWESGIVDDWDVEFVKISTDKE